MHRSSYLLAFGLFVLPLLGLAQPAPRANLAKYQSASASVSNGNYAPDFAVDGIVSNFHSWRTGNQTGPYWLELSYPRLVTLARPPLSLSSAPATEPNVRITNIGPHLELAFLCARADITFEVLASSPLAPDSCGIIATNPGSVSLTEPVTVTDPEPVSENPRRFLRFRVTRP